MKQKIRIGLLYGGKSAEREVSYLSAQAVSESLDPDRYDVYPVAVSSSGRWMLVSPDERLPHPEQLESRLLGQADPEQKTYPVPAPITTAQSGERPPLDLVFPLIHGAFGEDGSLQGFLEICGLPYVGTGVTGSALGMDKLLMKDVLRNHGLPVGPYTGLRRTDWERKPDERIESIEQMFPYPLFVKPARTGSSVGISKAHNQEELRAALDLACKYDNMVVVEQAMSVRELECGVIGTWAPQVSVVGEVIPERNFYDYHSKYLSENTQIQIPARIPTKLAQETREIARRAYSVLRCSGYARLDLFLATENDTIYVNEVNTIPGFTAHSMFPLLWEASGVSFSELLDRLIGFAMERYEDESRNSYDVPEEGVAPPDDDWESGKG